MVVRNPAVRRTSPYLELAAARGVPIEMEMSLFLRRCPAPVIAITGTKGKTSTAAICGAILQCWHPGAVVAGNMGVSALDQLDVIRPDTPVVLEISSWQLESWLDHHLAPHIAVLTNISEDHLDTYPDFTSYADVKRGITWYQAEDDIFIANIDDPEVWQATETTRARVIPFGLDSTSPTSGAPHPPAREEGAGERWPLGVWVAADHLVCRDQDRETTFTIPDRHWYRGGPAKLNAAAAVAAARAAGADATAIQEGLDSYTGVPNRMELVATINGTQFINDTAATAPAAALAALDALRDARIHIIAGGSDKRTDLAPLATALARHAHSIHLLAGTATDRLQPLLLQAGAAPAGPFDSMRSAVESAAAAARPGDVVVLSPGCASFGLFRDEFDRGEQFRAVVSALSNIAEPV